MSVVYLRKNAYIEHYEKHSKVQIYVIHFKYLLLWIFESVTKKNKSELKPEKEEECYHSKKNSKILQVNCFLIWLYLHWTLLQSTFGWVSLWNNCEKDPIHVNVWNSVRSVQFKVFNCSYTIQISRWNWTVIWSNLSLPKCNLSKLKCCCFHFLLSILGFNRLKFRVSFFSSNIFSNQLLRNWSCCALPLQHTSSF